MITTHTEKLAPQYTPAVCNQSNFFNSLALSIAEDQGELCPHWVKKSEENQCDLPNYHLHKIRLVFKEADSTRNKPFKIRIQCLSCQRKNICNEKDRFHNTEKLLTKHFLRIYEVNLDQNQRQQLEF